jgi:hypothetical protein
LVEALRHLEARYAPECLTTCEMAFLCRSEARGTTTALGRSVQEDLGGVDRVAAAIGLAEDTLVSADDQRDAAAVLQLAHRLRCECLGGAA